MNILSLLNECGFSFNKRLGQNFLTDANLLRAVVSDAGIEAGDRVVEVGAGAGTLTRALAETASAVTAYEIDRNLRPVLERSLEGLFNVDVRFEDVLAVSDDALCPKEAYKVVANLPYYITTPVLFRFVESSRPPRSITVTVQKEVADRLTARAGASEYGAVTASLSLTYTARTVRGVPRTLFTPQPNVDSAVVRMDFAPKTDNPAPVRRLIKAAFSMRRKTLSNNLSGAGYAKTAVACALEAMGVAADVRGERLTAEDYIRLYGLLTNSAPRA